MTGTILTSVHGNRIGLDDEDNLIIKGKGLVASNAVETGSTAASFDPLGATVFGSTAAKSYTLGDTPVGGFKYLRCTAGTTAALQTVNSPSTSVTFDGTKRKLVFNAANDAVILLRESATRFAIYANVGSVAVSS
jgi:hypothetical protein